MRAYAVKMFCEPVAPIEQPDPQPTGTEVVIDVTRCGVCHSDLHIQDGYYDLGGGKRLKSRRSRRVHAGGHGTRGSRPAHREGPRCADRRQRDRQDVSGLSVARLRHMRHLPARRGELLPEAGLARRLPSRRLRRKMRGATSETSRRCHRHRSDAGRDLCVLRHHRLQRAQEDRDRQGQGNPPDHGARRRGPERTAGRARTRLPQHCGGRHRPRQA